MIGYASRTGTRRNLDALRAAGWRLMVSARGVLRTEGFRYALDNGAWTSHQRGEPCYLHVGRVNSCRRIYQAQDAGAHSFDGTSATRFATTLPLLDGARRQGQLW